MHIFGQFNEVSILNIVCDLGHHRYKAKFVKFFDHICENLERAAEIGNSFPDINDHHLAVEPAVVLIFSSLFGQLVCHFNNVGHFL